MKHTVTFDDPIDLVQPLYDLLTTGEAPQGVSIEELPTFSEQQAFSLIWFLQEIVHVLPDHIEQCAVCYSLFDTNCGGYILGGGDDVDDWHKRQGVTEAMVSGHEGTAFCSEGCEASFWREQHSTK